MHDVAFVLDHVRVTDCPSVIGVVGATVSITVGAGMPLVLAPPGAPQDVRVNVVHTIVASQMYPAAWSKRIESSRGWTLPNGPISAI